MNPQFSTTWRTCMQRIGDDLTTLIGTPVEAHRQEVEVGRQLAGRFASTLYRCATRRLDARKSVAGFVLGEDLAIRLGATLLMMPMDTPDMTEDIELAFEEVVNMVTGSWKSAASNPSDQLDNDVDVRAIERVEPPELEQWLAEQDLELVVAPVCLDEDETYPLGFFGPREWIHGSADQEGAGASGFGGAGLKDVPRDSGWVGGRELNTSEPEPGFGLGAPLGESKGPTQWQGPGAPAMTAPGGPQAVLMVVDDSGELNEWLVRHMREGSLRFYRPGQGRPEITERSTLVVLGPNPELFRQLEVQRCIVAVKHEDE